MGLVFFSIFFGLTLWPIAAILALACAGYGAYLFLTGKASDLPGRKNVGGQRKPRNVLFFMILPLTFLSISFIMFLIGLVCRGILIGAKNLS